MDADSTYLLASIVLLLILSGFASLAEGAFISLNRVRLRQLLEEGLPKSEAIDRLLQEPQSVLSSILVVNTLAMVGAAALTTVLALRYLPKEWAPVAAIAALSLVVVVFAESVPKTLATENPERVAVWFARPIELLNRLLTPLIVVVEAISALVLLPFRRGRPAPPRLVTEEELRLIVADAEEEGTIGVDEREMIHSIFELEETTAREIMVPRIDVAALEASATIDEAIALINERGYSRIPIYEETIDHIVGVVYAKDLLIHLRRPQPAATLRALARPPHFIPETKHVDELLHELQQQRVHMAIVVDEYGGTAGLVTIEDLIEEIVGEIQDEYDREEARVQKVSENEAILDGRASIAELEDLFGLTLETDGYDTIGGFVYNQLGKIPSVGDEIQVDGLAISVLATSGQRILKVRVVRTSEMAHRASA